MTLNNRAMNGDRSAAIRWAQDVLKHGHYVLLDTETTGLDNDDEIVQITILGENGQSVFTTLVQPTKAIVPAAAAIRHLTAAMLANAPTFPQVYEHIKCALDNRRVITMARPSGVARRACNAPKTCHRNAAFVTRLLDQCCQRYGLPLLRYFVVECAMLQYAAFVGECDDGTTAVRCAPGAQRVKDVPSKRGGWKWQKLPGGDHSAGGDCQAMLDLIRKMAEAQP